MRSTQKKYSLSYSLSTQKHSYCDVIVYILKFGFRLKFYFWDFGEIFGFLKKINFYYFEVISEKLNEKFVIAGEKKTENKFRSARRALFTFNCDLELPGWDKGIQELKDFFHEKLDEEESASLYVSGSPGNFLILWVFLES
jgi:hypothetical protein